MKFPEGEFSAAPKTIYWIGLPNTITRDIEIDILKRDILIIPWDSHFTSFYRLTKTIHPRTVYFFNIDAIIKNNNINKGNKRRFQQTFTSFIREYFPLRNLLYSNQDPDEANVYNLSGMVYHNPCFSKTGDLFASIMSFTNDLIAHNPVDSEAPRSSFRLLLLPLSYTMEIILPGETGTILLKGYIKDISLSGVGCMFDTTNCLASIKKKSLVSIRLFLHTTIVSIHPAIIARINDKTGEIGIAYNINDRSIIDEKDSDTLTSVMYTWLNQVMYEYERKYT